VDELTGEKTTKRATYDDTRKAEKEGKQVTYTNRENYRRTQENIDNAKKGINTDGETKIGNVNSSTGKAANEIMVKHHEGVKKEQKAYVKENKNTQKDKDARKLDRAEQDRVERNAVKAKKKKKGDTSNTEPLTREQRRVLAINDAKTTSKVDPNKPGDEGASYHVSENSEKRDEAKKKNKKAKKSPATKIWPFKKKLKSSGAELVRDKKKKARGKKIKTSKNKLRNAFNKTTKKISDKIKEPGKKGNRPGFD